MSDALEIARRLRTKGMAYQGATADLVALLNYVENRESAQATHSEECWRWHLGCCRLALERRDALLRKWVGDTGDDVDYVSLEEETRAELGGPSKETVTDALD